MNPAHHLQYAVANAPVRTWPYPHIYVEDVFPWDFYERLVEAFDRVELPRFNESGRVGKAYPDERYLAPLSPVWGDVWAELHEVLLDGTFMNALLDQTFAGWMRHRFGSGVRVDLSHEVLVTRDVSGFALGPHTDSPAKVVTALFYLPVVMGKDLTHWHDNVNVGTSIYVPKAPTFRCRGGAHHPHDRFHRVHTAPYRPNSMFAFFKTDNSFHGVEPVESAEPRRLLIYDAKVAKSGA